MSPPDPLLPLMSLPGVPEAATRAGEAIASVHRHRSNLKGWRTTSIEAGLRAARASAAIEGADIRIPEEGEVRDPILAGALRIADHFVDASGRTAAATWRRAPLQELAKLHVLAAAGLVDEPGELGRPLPIPQAQSRLAALADLIASPSAVPAPVFAAVVHGEIATMQPFGTGDGVIARAASRLVAVSTGLDPRGLSVPEVSFYRDVSGYRAALAGFASGESDGVCGWIVRCCEAFEDGAREAHSIAEAAS